MEKPGLLQGREFGQGPLQSGDAGSLGRIEQGVPQVFQMDEAAGVAGGFRLQAFQSGQEFFQIIRLPHQAADVLQMAASGLVVFQTAPKDQGLCQIRRQPVFFSDADYQTYLDLLAEWSAKAGLAVWAYCLMPNHVHLVAVPETEKSLHLALGETHRRYTRHINFREGWRGHLWQGRFASFPLDEEHGLRAVRYVELNPVRAKLALRPEDWRWSSARAHISGVPDALLAPGALAEYNLDWPVYLQEPELELFRRHERTGHPLGGAEFVSRLEKQCHRTLTPGKPGPKRKE